MSAVAEHQDVLRWCQACRRPLLVTHRRPDGDALGAVAALALALQDLGLDPRPTLFEPFPPRYALLQGLVAWHRWDEQQTSLTADCDALVILDTCAWSQLEPLAAYLPVAPRTLVIDHHPTRDPLATRSGDQRWFDESAGAVCLLIAEWVTACGLHLPPAMATALLTGVGTDSGWFRFPNADARLLRTAAQLVDAGAALSDVYRAVHEQEPVAKLRLIGRMLQTLELDAGGRLAILTLRPADFVAAGANPSMTEDLVNEAGRIAGLEAVVLFTDEGDGRVRVNFRSKHTLDVAALAARYGGGGHARAAGARPAGSWNELVPRIVADLRQALDATPA